MKVSAREKDIVARIGHHGDKSLPEIARISGHQIHTVRTFLERCKEQGLVRQSWTVDVFRLGWQRYHVFFSMALTQADQRKKFVEAVRRSTRVASSSELAGEYDFHITVLGREVSDVLSFLQELTERFGMVFFSKLLTIQNLVTYFPRKYLASGPFKASSRESGHIGKTEVIDLLDHRLLCTLAAEPSITKIGLSDRLGVSAVTVHDRFKRLRERKILLGASYIFNLAGFGMQNYRALLNMRGIGPGIRQNVFAWGLKDKHCTSVAEGFGALDYELGFEIEHADQLIAIKDDLRMKFSDSLSELKVLSRLRSLKAVSYPFSESEFGERLNPAK